MSSVIEGYNYDIFISYRQKDNKGDRWVSEFVEALKTELESTFKEEISVYFDINPHDGLLETHDVDASLKEKLKCLIFIPIISRTYCDPKSFAWEHEFIEFVKQASQDQFGLKVKLPNGNVANRVLPVRIHDLDNADIKQCESVLGGVLRGIDFIYKESGIDKPLTADDDEKKNINNTKYRIQVVKVAHAIREIITAIGQHGQKPEGVSKEFFKPASIPQKSNKTKIITVSVILLALIVLGYFFMSKLLKSSASIEKSLAVLPFINDSRNDSTTYFMDGVMEEILTDLQTVKNLRVISRTSVEQYRNTTKSIPQIAKELGINYIVEGSGQKYGNTFVLNTQLIRATGKESHLWAKSFEQEIKEVKDIFSIKQQIAQAITSELEATVTTKEKKLIEKIPTENLEAYEDYLKGKFYLRLRKFTANDIDTAMHYFNLAKEIDPGYAAAYAGICEVWQFRQQFGLVPNAVANANEKTAIMKALELDSTNAWVQFSLADWRTWGLWDWKGAESAYKKSIELNPNDGLTRATYSQLLNILGRPKEAMEQIEIALKLDPVDPFIMTFYGIDLFIVRKYDESIKAYSAAMKIEPGYSLAMGNLASTLHMQGKFKDELECDKSVCTDPELVKALEQGYIEGGYKGACISYNKVAELRAKTSYWSSWDIATTYAMAGENDKAIKWLQKAFELHDPVLPYLLMPILDNLREDPRFQEIARKMNLPYK